MNSDEGFVFLIAFAISCCILYLLIRFGVKHGIRDANRQAAAERQMHASAMKLNRTISTAAEIAKPLAQSIRDATGPQAGGKAYDIVYIDGNGKSKTQSIWAANPTEARAVATACGFKVDFVR